MYISTNDVFEYHTIDVNEYFPKHIYEYHTIDVNENHATRPLLMLNVFRLSFLGAIHFKPEPGMGPL